MKKRGRHIILNRTNTPEYRFIELVKNKLIKATDRVERMEKDRNNIATYL